MSRKISVLAGNIATYGTHDVDVMSFDYNIDGKCGHRVIVKTTKKFKQSLKTKIVQYCKSRRK